jgi:hypothetical protein
MAESRRYRSRRLARAEKAAHGLACAIRALDEHALAEIGKTYVRVLEYPSNPDEAFKNNALVRANLEFARSLDEIQMGQAIARSVAKAINLIPVNSSEPKKPRYWVDEAIEFLVEEFGSSYAEILGYAPSYSREGTFSKSLQAIRDVAGIEVALGEKALVRILRDVRNRSPKPKPGPKRRPKPNAS